MPFGPSEYDPEILFTLGPCFPKSSIHWDDLGRGIKNAVSLILPHVVQVNKVMLRQRSRNPVMERYWRWGQQSPIRPPTRALTFLQSLLYPESEVLETCSATLSTKGFIRSTRDHLIITEAVPDQYILFLFPISSPGSLPPSPSTPLLFAPQSMAFLNFRAPVWLITQLAKELHHLINRKLAVNVTFGL